MKHFLLLELRNALKHNSIKFSAARLHVSSDKFWNCLKDRKCNNVQNSCLLVNKRTLCLTNLKKNICKTFYRLKCKEFRKTFQKSAHLLRCTKSMSHVGYWYIIIHFIFFSTTYLPKMVCFLNSWKQIVNTIVRWDAWLVELLFGRNNWFNTCYRKKRYYQTKTQLRYNFGSVYLLHWTPCG